MSEPGNSSWRCVLESAFGDTPDDRRNLILFATLIIAWALSQRFASYWIENSETTLLSSLAVAAVPFLFAVLTLLSYLKYLRGADELAQKVQLEGLALGFGIGIMYGFGAELLGSTGIYDTRENTMQIVMLVSWALGQLFAAWRYR